MGMTAPALYRYFADRDELLSALMVDGFQEMSDALTAALDTAAPDDLVGRIRAAAIAYRPRLRVPRELRPPQLDQRQSRDELFDAEIEMLIRTMGAGPGR
jgi:AcrR family transcriptional regulator